MLELHDMKITIAMGVVILLTLVNSCNSCSHSGQISKLRGSVERLDSTVAEKPDVREFELMLRAEGLRTSQRDLYGQNAVLRTTARPDDLMAKYGAQVDSLEQELK